MYYPNSCGFDRFLKSCRSHNIENVEYTVRINLAFHVQSHIAEEYNLEWTDSSARVVYVEFRGQEEHYGAVQDESSSEIL